MVTITRCAQTKYERSLVMDRSADGFFLWPVGDETEILKNKVSEQIYEHKGPRTKKKHSDEKMNH